MATIDQWNATWRELGAADSPALQDAFEDLVARYAEPHRKYHTLEHLDECLATFANVRALAGRPAEVEVALWFHDAIYDTRSNSNEKQSAALAASTVREALGSPECAGRVGALVMATRHVELPTDGDTRLLVDVDLSILGANPVRFDAYERQVREEYAWVPDMVFRTKRRKILEGFLARPAIFSTPYFRQRLEARARANIARSLEVTSTRHDGG